VKMVGFTALGFGLGFAGSIGVFFGLHFLWSAVQHGGWF